MRYEPPTFPQPKADVRKKPPLVCLTVYANGNIYESEEVYVYVDERILSAVSEDGEEEHHYVIDHLTGWTTSLVTDL